MPLKYVLTSIQGHWKMTPFDFPRVCHWNYNFIWYRFRHIWRWRILWPWNHWNPRTLAQSCVFAANSLDLGLYSFMSAHITQSRLVRYCCSRSLWVIEICTSRTPIWRLISLLSFSRCNDILVESLCFSPFYPPQSRLKPIARMRFPVGPGNAKFGLKKLPSCPW